MDKKSIERDLAMVAILLEGMCEKNGIDSYVSITHVFGDAEISISMDDEMPEAVALLISGVTPCDWYPVSRVEGVTEQRTYTWTARGVRFSVLETR